MLRFITVFHARIKGERHVSSLAIGGKPHYQPAGYAKVVGNMEHGSSFVPATEADRIEMVRWLQSPELISAIQAINQQ